MIRIRVCFPLKEMRQRKPPTLPWLRNLRRSLLLHLLFRPLLAKARLPRLPPPMPARPVQLFREAQVLQAAFQRCLPLVPRAGLRLFPRQMQELVPVPEVLHRLQHRVLPAR